MASPSPAAPAPQPAVERPLPTKVPPGEVVLVPFHDEARREVTGYYLSAKDKAAVETKLDHLALDHHVSHGPVVPDGKGNWTATAETIRMR